MEVYTRRSRSPTRDDPYGARIDDAYVGRNDMGRSMTETYRRRSPGPQDRNRIRGGRARSRSPMQIDRYQPGRPSREDYYGASRRADEESRRRRSPPILANGTADRTIDRYVPGQEPSVPVINPLPNPLTLEYQVGFNWFAEWWRKDQEVKEERDRQKHGVRRQPPRLKGEQEVREAREKERNQIQGAYDGYKEQLQVQMARTFVQQHKRDEWFKERYDPEIRDPLRRRLAEFRRGTYEQWQQDLDSGVFDDFTLEGIYKSESNGAGGVVEKEEGETTAAAEVLGVGDLVPSKGGDLRDEAAMQSALLIKTIAPHVSREKMEGFCKEHLGDGEGGFRWLSLSDPNPLKKCHRIGWVMLNPGGDHTEAPARSDDRGDGRDEEGEGNEDGEGTTHFDSSTTMEGITQSFTDKALNAINGKSIVDEERGNFQCHVGIHVPASMPRKKALWDLFSAPERVERDLQLAMRIVSKMEQELGEDINGVNKVEERVEEIRSKGMLQPVKGSAGVAKPPRGSDDGRDEGEELEVKQDDEEEEGAWDEETDDEDSLAKKKKLDLLVEYMRRVFSFCFFCVFESDSVHELTRKCPGGHLRRPRASLTSSAVAVAKASAYGEPFPLKRSDSTTEQDNEDGSPVAEKKFNKSSRTLQQLQRAFNWVKTYEDKLFQILEPESADLKKLGGRPVEEALEEELKKFVKQEDVAKFRCRVPDCQKLFKGENFWRKHVEKRHTEWFEGIKKDLNLINLYVLDPAHITPSRSDANSNGHFPTNNHMPAGTPRGFNLSALAPFGFPAGMPPPGAFPTNFGQYPVTVPSGMWAGPGMNFGMDVSGGIGPMRRGVARYNNRMGGPYDRSSRDNRNMRHAINGRLTPPRGGGGMGGGQSRFPDSAVGAAMGPREAVAGRSLKSYEDLDAVGVGASGASGNGELNY